MRLYRLLLHVFPAPFRRRFGKEMAETFADRLREARRLGRRHAAAAWLRAVPDLLAHGLAERRLAAARTSGVRATMNSLTTDLVYGLRVLRRRPGFAAAAMLTVALGVGVNVAIFSVVRAVLINDLPYPEPGQLVHVSLRTTKTPNGGMVPSIPVFEFLQTASPMLRAMVTAVDGQATLSGVGAPEQIQTAQLSAAAPEVAGLPPLAGRMFGPGDYRDTSDIVLISERLWRSRFNGHPDAVGQRIRLDGTAQTIVGVVSDAFDFNLRSDRPVDVWQPLRWLGGKGSISSTIVARLPAGADQISATQEVDRLIPQLSEGSSSGNAILGISLTPLVERYRAGMRPGLLLLQAAAGLLLLIACANLANLLLAHASSRRRELGVRAAIGAARGRLIRQMLVEAVATAALGGGLGVLLAYWTAPVLVASASWTLPRPALVAVGFPELAIGLALAIGTAVVASTVPAWMAVRSDLLASLRTTANVTASQGSRLLRDALIALEVMLAVTILAGAGLLINSFARVVSLPMGFDVNGLVVGDIPVASAALQSETSRNHFMRELRGALIAGLGVRDVAFANSMPYTSGFMGGATLAPPAGDERRVFFTYHIVSDEFFDTFRIPLLRGRLFAATDVASGERVAIVNEQFVREFMPVGEIIGTRMTSGRRALTVVGVAGDTRNGDITRPPQAAVYWPLAQQTGTALRVAVRGAPVQAVDKVIRATLARTDPDLAPGRIETVESRVRYSLAQRRFYLLVLTLFAALGTVLAAVGISGVAAHVAGQRTREFAIRLALGSTPRQVLALVVRQSVQPLLLGLVAGLIGAWWLTDWLQANRTFSSQLYGIDAQDVTTFGAAAFTLLAIGVAASWIPARRTTRIDPVGVLKVE